MNDPNPSGNPGGLLAREAQAAALWEQLRHFKLDDGNGPRTFAWRLAEEQGWPAEFTARAIEEYRRFLLLFALGEKRQSGDPSGKTAVRIVPSAIVDKVWHLHLLYTRSYWETLCGGILGVNLHHQPADGSSGESRSLDAVYRANMEAYRATFGQEAPADIWPAVTAARPLPLPPAGVPIAEIVSRMDRPPVSRRRIFYLASVSGIVLFVMTGLIFMRGPQAENELMTVVWVIFGIIFIGCVVISGVIAGVNDAGRKRPGLANRNRCSAWGWGGSGCSGGVGDSGGHGHSHSSHSCGGHSHSCGGHSCGGHGCGGGH